MRPYLQIIVSRKADTSNEFINSLVKKRIILRQKLFITEIADTFALVGAMLSINSQKLVLHDSQDLMASPITSK